MTFLTFCQISMLFCTLFFQAYEVLSDEKKRRQYDQFGEDGLKGEGFRTGSFDFDDFFKGFEFGGFGRGGGNKRGGNGFKFSFGGGFDDFFNDDDDYFEEEDSGFGGGFGDGFGDFGDFGDSFFGHHRNNHGDGMHTRQMYRDSSSMCEFILLTKCRCYVKVR